MSEPPVAVEVASASREFDPGCDPIELFERLRRDPFPWLLDSASPSREQGRYSFAGASPYAVLKARGRSLELECLRSARPDLDPGRKRFAADPLTALRELCPTLPASASSGETPFVGGAVGYLGYELAGVNPRIEFTATDDLGLPDLYFLFVDRMVAFDHVRQRFAIHALGFDRDRAAAMRRAEAVAEAFARRCGEPASGVPRASGARASRQRGCTSRGLDASIHVGRVEEVKQEIAVGNVYQVCLTHRLEEQLSADPWEYYRRLRLANPAPFASYFEFPEFAIASSSPERFLRLTSDRVVESRPIKGTRPRSAIREADDRLREELARSPKDRAENLMIVDLVRNDLGRVCEVGSVTVPELMAVEDHAAVFQMVSSVRGRLRCDRDAVDLVRAAFPPGSMTGAPKLAAMQIIDRIETARRGVYSGGLGYFDVRGGIELCVVIRTALLRDGRAYIHTGGGIVADSEPRAEYEESLDKARPLQHLASTMRREAAGWEAAARDQAT